MFPSTKWDFSIISDLWFSQTSLLALSRKYFFLSFSGNPQMKYNFIMLFLARICVGFLCNCVLPLSLNETKVRQIRSEDRVCQAEKKKLRSHSSRFVSSSNNTPPSLSPHSSGSANRSCKQKRCLPPSSSLIHKSSPSTLEL